MFFDFIVTKTAVTEPCSCFQLQWFVSTLPVNGVDQIKLWKALLRGQQNAMFEWFDRFRTGAGPELIAQILPPALQTCDFEDSARWPLVCFLPHHSEVESSMP